MPIITQLKTQKDKNRVNVYLDNKQSLSAGADKFAFGIDLDNFVLLGLHVGQELSDSEVEKIIKKAEFQKTFDKLFRWVISRPHSKKEIYDYLKRKKISEVLYEDLFEKLDHFHVINDEEFTRFWIESRNAFNVKPKKILKLELKMKGVEQNIVDKILGENEIDEDKIAVELLKKRDMHWKRIEKAKRSQKMLAYLVGKGFAFEVAQKAIRSYNMEYDKAR